MVPVFALLGLIPILGLGLALLVYRVGPGAALVGFASWRDRLGVRALRGATVFVLALLQPVPVLGAAAVLTLVAAQQAWARRAFLLTTGR